MHCGAEQSAQDWTVVGWRFLVADFTPSLSPGALGKNGEKCYKAEFLHIGQEYHPNQHIKSPRKSNWSFLQKSLKNVSEIGHK